jgi:hypothetical protein
MELKTERHIYLSIHSVRDLICKFCGLRSTQEHARHEYKGMLVLSQHLPGAMRNMEGGGEAVVVEGLQEGG